MRAKSRIYAALAGLAPGPADLLSLSGGRGDCRFHRRLWRVYRRYFEKRDRLGLSPFAIGPGETVPGFRAIGERKDFDQPIPHDSFVK